MSTNSSVHGCGWTRYEWPTRWLRGTHFKTIKINKLSNGDGADKWHFMICSQCWHFQSASRYSLWSLVIECRFTTARPLNGPVRQLACARAIAFSAFSYFDYFFFPTRWFRIFVTSLVGAYGVLLMMFPWFHRFFVFFSFFFGPLSIFSLVFWLRFVAYHSLMSSVTCRRDLRLCILNLTTLFECSEEI